MAAIGFAHDKPYARFPLRSRLLAVAAVALVAGCAAGPAKPPADRYVRYRCADGREFGVTYQQHGARALLEAEGWSYLLRGGPAQSGNAYTDGKATLHIRNDGAAVDGIGTTTYDRCKAMSKK